MDVYGIFIPDMNLSYGTMRNSVYRDYEEFPYGTFEKPNNPKLIDSFTKAQEKCRKTQRIEAQKQSCPFCSAHKKRPLIRYLHKHHDRICEEDEEGEEATEATETVEVVNGVAAKKEDPPKDDKTKVDP